MGVYSCVGVCVFSCICDKKKETEIENKKDKGANEIKRGDENRDKGRKTHSLSDGLSWAVICES